MNGKITYPPVTASMYFWDYRFDLIDGPEEWTFYVSDLDNDPVVSFPLGYRPMREYEAISKAFWDCVVIFLREYKNPNIKGL